MKAKVINITVKDDAKPIEVDTLIQCFTILCEALKMDAVIIYDEQEIDENEK